MKVRRKVPIKILAILLFALIVFFLGYFRNYVFMAINAQTSAIYYHTQGPDFPPFLQFITAKDYWYLIKLKWALTIAFALLFFGTSMLTLKIFFKESIYLKMCGVLYGFLVLASAFMMALGYFFRSFSFHAFNIARNIMHISQSPFTILFLCIVAYYYKRTNASR